MPEAAAAQIAAKKRIKGSDSAAGVQGDRGRYSGSRDVTRQREKVRLAGDSWQEGWHEVFGVCGNESGWVYRAAGWRL